MSLSTFRNLGYRLIPNWAHGGNLFRVLYAIWIIVDALGDMLLAAVKIRFPGYYSNESLPRLSSERMIYQGPNESPSSFAARLATWWDVAKHSAMFLTMAQQIQAYCLPGLYRVEIVQNNGLRYTLGADGSWTIDQTTWNWDGDTMKWSRFWVLLSNTSLGVTGYDATIENASLTIGAFNAQPDGRDVGSDTPFLNYDTSPVPDHREIRRIMEVHRAPHACCDLILLLLGHDNFWASPPAGNWDRWKNRSSLALYWEGTPR